MGIIDIFRPLKKTTVQKWKELGAYESTFNVFGGDPYKSSVVRSCVRTLADFSAKSTAICTDDRIGRILNDRPNLYMNGKDFIYKCRTLLEINNTCFIYLQRDNSARVVGFYPIPYVYFEAVEYANGLFINFQFGNNEKRTLPWSDLAVLRKDYNKYDLAGDSNDALLTLLEIANTTDQGLVNSIKSTANLRGILKSTKAMLAPEQIKAQKDAFVNDYMGLSNQGGIASLDSTQEFTPITMSPMTATYAQMKEVRENIYRYFGVNDEIIMGTVSTEQLENFYKLRIEPFLIGLSRELTSKVYAGKALAYNNSISFQVENGQFMTMSQKIELFNKVVLYAGMTTNEWRALSGYPPLPDGDTPVMRLDAAPTNSEKFTDPNGDGVKEEKEEIENEQDTKNL